MLLNPLGRRDFGRAKAENLAASWTVVLLAGIVSLVLGVLVLAIDWTVSSLAFFVGILFIFQGLVYVVARPRDGSSRSVGIVVGLVAAAGGVALMVWPDIGLLTLGVVAGCWLVARGILNVAGAFAQRHVAHWWLVLALGVVEIPI